MDQYKTNCNQITKDKFMLIQNHFTFLTDNSINQQKLIKKNSHKNFLERPLLKKKKNIVFEPPRPSRNPLEQIGKDDLIFSKDNLITNINLEQLEDYSPRDSINNGEDNMINNKKIATVKKNKQIFLTPIRNGKNGFNSSKNNNKNNKSGNNMDSLELNCNKMPYNNTINKKGNIYKNPKNNKNYVLTARVKNISQFINKHSNEYTSKKPPLITPSKNKHSSKMSCNSSFSKLNFNDSISIGSVSRIGASSCVRGKSMTNMHNKKTTIHFPNKSVLKNKDKLYIELQKIFGDKLQLDEEMFNNMTETDKKSCINFLLNAIKELFTLSKMDQSKIEGYKEITEAKEKQLKSDKNEIKELKKDIMKLNKIIKTNIQVNRKLTEKNDNLKLQLQREKNKNNTMKSKGKSLNKTIHDSKFKNEIKGLNMTSIKRNRNMSLDRNRDTNEFINKKKINDIDRNHEDDPHSNNNEIKEEGKLMNNINTIEIEEDTNKEKKVEDEKNKEEPSKSD